MSKKRERLDQLLLEHVLASSVEEARALIMAGVVSVNGNVVSKSGELFSREVRITVQKKNQFVSRGGYKLDGALSTFGVSVSSRVCADIGCSTGGFSDVLLQRGASKVYAIDTGYGDLAWKVRSDPKVVVMERTNVLELTTLPETIDFCCIDVSLLSLLRVVPHITPWLSEQGEIIALFKPQYEALRHELPKGAIIDDPELHSTILTRVMQELQACGSYPRGIIPSPIRGMSGNKEFLVWFSKTPPESPFDIAAAIAQVTH